MLSAVGGSALIHSGTGLLVFGPGQMLTVAFAEGLAVGLYVVGGLLLTSIWR